MYYNWLIVFQKLRRNADDSLNPLMFRCQVCRESEGMCKNSEGFFCRSAALVVAAAGGTSIDYVATSTAMRPTRRTFQCSNHHSNVLGL